jgi:bifunctional DNA-binding transcriptional regulator/antitoxin component of YhaV-PrlF toxin-antitoxin module
MAKAVIDALVGRFPDAVYDPYVGVGGDDCAFVKRERIEEVCRFLKTDPALKFDRYEVKKVEEKGDEATVTVDVSYYLVVPAKDALNLSMAVTEPWVRLEGQWYRQLPQAKL